LKPRYSCSGGAYRDPAPQQEYRNLLGGTPVEHVFDEAGEVCSRCLGDRAEGDLPTHCVGYPMTEKQFSDVHDCDIDFRDGEWIALRPPLTAALIAKFGSQGVPMKSCGYELIRFGCGFYDDSRNWYLTVRRVPGNEERTWIYDMALIEDGHLLVRHHQVWGLRPVLFVEMLDIGSAMAADFLRKMRKESKYANWRDDKREEYNVIAHEIINATGPNVMVRPQPTSLLVFTKEEIRQAAQSM
jgi:hypothetical protein